MPSVRKSPTPPPFPQSAAVLASPPPPTTPVLAATAIDVNRPTSPTTMTVDGISGGAALIGISQGPLATDPSGELSGPNVHVVIKASSRLRLQEFLQEALDHNASVMANDPKTKREGVFLHLSTYNLMLGAKGGDAQGSREVEG
jgi:hypothetical protein